MTGYGSSSLIYSAEDERWELHNFRLNQSLVAAKAGSGDFPVGAHRWTFEDSSCRDGGEGDYRTMNLHLAVKEPGTFCCESGQCISSALVCDDVKNCGGREDEQDCLHLLTDEDYRRDKGRWRKRRLYF